MATPIKRIEKDFLLKVVYDEQIPVKYMKNRTEYTLTLEKPVKERINLKAGRLIPGLRPGRKMNLMFNFRGRMISFSITIQSFLSGRIQAEAPEFLYRDLRRSYLRVQGPRDIRAQFLFSGERYSLDYPKIHSDEGEIEPRFQEYVKNDDLKNLDGLIAQFSRWIEDYSSGRQLILFGNLRPSSLEECLISETGKAVYLPSTLGSFPKNDPYPEKLLITEDIFLRCIESSSADFADPQDAAVRFIRAKFDSGIFSDAWVPIQFYQYIIGYIHIWINELGRPPFSYDVIAGVFQFAGVLSFSMKESGCFESGRIKNTPFEGKIIDISVSGLLFAYPLSAISEALAPGSELSVTVKTPVRSISARARVVRRYKDNIQGYFGCRFLDMRPEDTRFFFEFIYGRPFTDAEAMFLTGCV
ncbi:MAG: PilZ domain-containing protein [Treponema sp.]|nr:PilZ domain-containing protein [Treponema sp.]